MVCVAVTRMGRGDFWAFGSRAEADEHPIVQYGDAICCSADDVFNQYPAIEAPILAAMLGDRVLEDSLKNLPWHDTRKRDSRYKEHVDRLWTQMQNRARQVPSDAAQVCKIVTEDRRTTKSPQFQKSLERFPANREDANMTEAATEAKEAKKPGRKSSKYLDDHVIKMGVDKEGKSYGAEHNPKRAGSKAADRFALYKDGMTVKEAQAVGLTTADFDNDIKHGFIAIEVAA